MRTERFDRKGSRKLIQVRLPEQMWEDIEKILQTEERSLNTQMVRFIREGIERYQASRQSPSSLRDFVKQEAV